MHKHGLTLLSVVTVAVALLLLDPPKAASSQEECSVMTCSFTYPNGVNAWEYCSPNGPNGSCVCPASYCNGCYGISGC